MTKPKQPTPADVLADLTQARSAMLDPLDIPGSWSQRDKNTYEARRRQLDASGHAIRQILSSLEGPRAKRAVALAGQKRLHVARAALETRLEATPESDAQTRALLQSALDAVHRGVAVWETNNAPMLPAPLRELLTDRCVTCGHETVAWPGRGLIELNEAITKHDATIAALEQRLARLVTEAATLLQEPAHAAAS
jgi:hypothetical protein